MKLTLKQSELTGYSASVLKSIIDGWTDADHREMEVTRESYETELFLTSHLTKLLELHEKSERRKGFSRKRIEDV